MNPTVASGGRSFKGAFAYYMHDKGADTRARIAWTHTVNMITDDPDKAWKVMAYTAKNQDRLKEAAGVPATGRKASKPVFAYSLSWHPEQSPTPDHMREVALKSIEVLGMADHQAVLVAHNDTPHAHVHVIVNRVHPLTGKVAGDSFTYRKLSDLALDYAREHGLTYSPQREENKRQREEGKATRYMDPKIKEAWANSADGKSFVAALKERGFELAQGNKRLVVVDVYGKVHNPTRHLDGVTAKDLQARLSGVDLAALRDANLVARERTAMRAKTPDMGTAFENNAGKTKTPDLKGDFEKSADRRKKAAERQETDKATAREETRKNPAVAKEITARKPDAPKTPANGPQEQMQLKLEPGKPAVLVPLSAEDKRAVEQEKAERGPRRLAELQNRHLEDYHDLDARLGRGVTKQKEELSKYYRMAEQKHEIDALRTKCENPSFWRKLFGMARRDRDRLEGMELTFANAQQRYDAQITALENERARTMGELKEAQRREWKVAERLYQPNGPQPEREKSGLEREQERKLEPAFKRAGTSLELER